MQSGRRNVVPGRTWRGAWTALAAACVLTTAAAGAARAERRTVEFDRPSAAPDADATGSVTVRTSRGRTAATVRLRHLDPRTRYQVRDGGTDALLGEVRTNRRGRARLRLRAATAAAKRAALELPDDLLVCDAETGTCVLSCALDGTGAAPLEGHADYAGPAGHRAFVELLSFGEEGVELFALTLEGPRTDRLAPPSELYEFVRDTLSGDALPLDVASVADLGGRAFRIRDGEGNVLLRGALPELAELELRLPPIGDLPFDLPVPDDLPDLGGVTRGSALPMRLVDGRGGALERIADFLPFPLPRQEESDLVLEIADRAGTPTDVGRLTRIVLPDFGDLFRGHGDCPGADDGDAEPADRTPATRGR
mgnify:CR=1 FL=1